MKKNRTQDAFLKELTKIPIVQVACERCGLSRQTVYRWRRDDPDFERRMDVALAEGEELVHDMCESQLLTLIKERNFPAIRYWLSTRHPKYKKLQVVIEKSQDQILKEKYQHLSDEELYERLIEGKKRLEELEQQIEEDHGDPIQPTS